MNPEREVIFNNDGTVDPAQLEGMPQEFIDRVTSPEFIAHAKATIQRLQNARRVRDLAHLEHQARRPNGISGRQRRKLRKLVRKVHSATLEKTNQEEGRTA